MPSIEEYAKLHCQVDAELRGLAYMAQRARQNSDLAEGTVLAVRTIQEDVEKLRGISTAMAKELKKKATAAYREGFEEAQDLATDMEREALETLSRIERICRERQSRRLFGKWPFRLFRRGAKEAS